VAARTGPTDASTLSFVFWLYRDDPRPRVRAHPRAWRIPPELRATSRGRRRGKRTASHIEQLYRLSLPLRPLCEWPASSRCLTDIHQAGEDLEETEEEDEEPLPDDAERLLGQPSGSEDTSALQADSEAAQNSLARILQQAQQPKSAVTETSPLLPRSSSLQRSRTRRRRGSVSHGDATVGQAVLMVRHDFASLAHWVACPPCFFLRSS
jgi:hypothetical protein